MGDNDNKIRYRHPKHSIDERSHDHTTTTTPSGRALRAKDMNTVDTTHDQPEDRLTRIASTPFDETLC